MDLKTLAHGFIETVSESLGDGEEANRQMLEFCALLAAEAEAFAEATEAAMSEPPDVTGNPWPDCICNDARYELGHMESCPAYGRPPDAPAAVPEA